MSDQPDGVPGIDELGIDELVDLDSFPLDDLCSAAYRSLVQRCTADLDRDGTFDLARFVRVSAINASVTGLRDLIDQHSFTHRRTHNIYFLPEVPGVPADHPALRMMETVNRTICADQIERSPIVRIYEWVGLRTFLSDVTGHAALYVMDDPMARVNVMSYRHGEALNWHFDRSEFTITVLLQAPQAGGEFQFRTDLRSNADPNHEGVARLLDGTDQLARTRVVEPGTLTMFRGHDTAHRVTPVEGSRDRIVAVLSYYDRPGVTFSPAERLGFYGRD